MAQQINLMKRARGTGGREVKTESEEGERNKGGRRKREKEDQEGGEKRRERK